MNKKYWKLLKIVKKKIKKILKFKTLTKGSKSK